MKREREESHPSDHENVPGPVSISRDSQLGDVDSNGKQNEVSQFEELFARSCAFTDE